MFTSAPLAISNYATSLCPNAEAKQSGANSPHTFTFAPLAISNSATSLCPFIDA